MDASSYMQYLHRQIRQTMEPNTATWQHRQPGSPTPKPRISLFSQYCLAVLSVSHAANPPTPAPAPAPGMSTSMSMDMGMDMGI